MTNENKGKRSAGNRGELHPKLIVGIGGSAGALNAYKALLTAMPTKTGKTNTKLNLMILMF